jgi:hypothetical protein
MIHKVSPRFRKCYQELPVEVRRLADRNYRLLRRDPGHPSLHYKTVGRFHSVRVGLHHRALAVQEGETLVWFWIGSHAAYDRLVGG